MPVLTCAQVRSPSDVSILCTDDCHSRLCALFLALACSDDNCGSESRTSTLPASGTSLGAVGGAATDGFLFFDPNNIIHGVTSQFSYGSGSTACSDPGFTARSNIPGFQGVTSTCLDYTCLTSAFSPLPESTSAMCTSPTAAPNGDAFYEAVTCSGAFKSSGAADNWMAGWSWLACSGKMDGATCTTGVPKSPFANLGDDVVLLNGNVATDTTLTASTIYVLGAQVIVDTGITLTIEKGTTILAMPPGAGEPAAALVVNKGATIMAAGTAAQPITMTSILAEEAMHSSETVQTDSASATGLVELGRRGKWGGLIILGSAPTSASSPKEIEGIAGYTYGGSDPTDTSGTLQYVRVWHGGAVIGEDNEINGITFGGVGSGTVVDHCEVAYNADDGFEFFGGTVNVKFLSVLFVGDDAFDSDEGYQGKGQFLVAMIGAQGNHGTEMDSKTNGDINSSPKSHPAFWSMTIIGGGAASTRGTSNALMRLREGTGGSFGNLILANADSMHVGVEFRDCGTEEHTQIMPEASASLNAPGYLYYSPNNIIHKPSTAFTWQESSGCVAAGFAYVDADPGFSGTFLENASGLVDPRPSCTSYAYSDIDTPSDSFYETVGFKGAFGNTNWLAGWSYLEATNRLATYPLNCVAGKPAPEPGIPSWGIAVFIILAVVLVLFGFFICFMAKKEKSGAPIFMQIDRSKGGDAGTTGNEMRSAA